MYCWVYMYGRYDPNIGHDNLRLRELPLKRLPRCALLGVRVGEPRYRLLRADAVLLGLAGGKWVGESGRSRAV
jgi:hypothetical protein